MKEPKLQWTDALAKKFAAHAIAAEARERAIRKENLYLALYITAATCVLIAIIVGY